jgi:hypothetical protein
METRMRVGRAYHYGMKRLARHNITNISPRAAQQRIVFAM